MSLQDKAWLLILIPKILLFEAVYIEAEPKLMLNTDDLVEDRIQIELFALPVFKVIETSLFKRLLLS